MQACGAVAGIWWSADWLLVVAVGGAYGAGMKQSGGGCLLLPLVVVVCCFPLVVVSHRASPTRG